LRYATYRLADGVTFLHVATVTADENPLASTAAFARFQEGLDERCAVPPSPSPATLIGYYDGLDPAETPKAPRPHS
jgi:hypothetical protein